MRKEQAPSSYRHYSESPLLAFWGTDLHIPGDPTTEEQFYTTLHCLETMTTACTEGEPGHAVTPQMVSDELTHFNQSVTAIRQGAGVPQPEVTVTLNQLHALSLRRLLATYDTKSAIPADYERFVHVHAALFLALHEEQEIERLRQQPPTEQLYGEDDVPF
jgi:hypothetical protein